MIILASTSQTRQIILADAGLKFTSERPQVDERRLVAENPQWTPEDISLRLAESKACDVSRRYPDALVIGADQVLAFGNRVHSKPRDIEDCRHHLHELRGQTHRLISSAVCARQGVTIWSLTDVATLTMRQFSEAFLEQYLASSGANSLKSVGGYQVEGLGIQLFSEISGDYFTILGLPLLPLLDYLRAESELLS